MKFFKILLVFATFWAILSGCDTQYNYPTLTKGDTTLTIEYGDYWGLFVRQKYWLRFVMYKSQETIIIVQDDDCDAKFDHYNDYVQFNYNSATIVVHPNFNIYYNGQKISLYKEYPYIENLFYELDSLAREKFKTCINFQ